MFGVGGGGGGGGGALLSYIRDRYGKSLMINVLLDPELESS